MLGLLGIKKLTTYRNLIPVRNRKIERTIEACANSITIADRPKRKIIATMKRYYVDKPDTTYA